ncbi:MAG: hypothetical protein QXN23_06630 [Candidatus Caldarchaeum sp.]|uniref:DUF131 domain-containing protein n=1 Tax=Caldiarchaeum subterraneum TaxID=311458 RepID=A0A7C4E0E8_CALS0|nr:hypothetical protein [Candidatus Caldarchaeales archaeon]
MRAFLYLVFLLFAAAFILPFALVYAVGDAAQFRGIGVFFIGPIPIFLDITDPRSLFTLLIPFLLIFILLFLAKAVKR